MGYAAYLRPRAETLSGEIEGIIDLANIKDGRRKRLEARPDLFFRLTTWRTSAVGYVKIGRAHV